MASPFNVYVDWDDSGTFGGTGEDVTSRVLNRSGMFFSRGKDQIRQFAPPAAGQFNAELNNQSKDYSPLYGSSPLTGLISPGKKVRVSVTGTTSGTSFEFVDGTVFQFVDGTTMDAVGGTTPGAVWTGILDDIPQNPSRESRSVNIPSYGTLSRLRGKKISTALYEDITTSQAIGYLLDAAGWPGSERDLDIGTVTLDWWWLDNEDAFSALVELLSTEGPGASIYENPDGHIVFENATSRTTQSRSTTSQATYQDTDIIGGLSYNPNFKDVIKGCVIQVNERQAQGTQEIWNYGGDLVLGNNEIKRIQVRGTGGDPFKDAQTPSPIGTNTIQTLTPSATLTSGQFTLTFSGQTTSALDWDSTAAEIQTALEALSNIAVGDVICTGGPINTDPVEVMFTGTYAGLDVTTLYGLITVGGVTLNPVSVPATITAYPIMDGNGSFLEQQGLAPSTTLTGGSFQLLVTHPSFGLQGTGTIAYNASAATIETELESIFHIGTASCYGGPISTSNVTCVMGVGADYELMEVLEITAITGNAYTATITVAETQRGGVPDYTITAGAATFALDRTSGAFVTLTITAGASGATIQGLRLRAKPVTIIRTHQAQYPADLSAIVEGQIYKPNLREEIDLDVAQDQAEAYVTYYSAPRPTVVIVMRCAYDSATALAHLSREISDRITVVEAQTGINHDFLIEQVRYSVGNKVLVTEFGCEKAA